MSQEADWSCTRDGSDTCIIEKGKLDVGDNIFVTIFCKKQCNYELKAFYAPEIELVNERRMTFRWGGHSTAILKYYVPELSGEGRTDSFNIDIEPEKPYVDVKAYFSLGKFNYS